MAQQRGAMAMRGGLGGGASERMAGGFGRNLALQQAGIRGAGEQQGMGIRLGIGQQDMGDKFALQQTLAGEMGTRRLGDIESKRGFDMQAYIEEMKTKSAVESARLQGEAMRGR